MSQEIININELQTLYLGKRGENDVTEILFDISELQLEYGSGTVELLARQPSSNELYPIIVTIEKNFAKWLVRLEDVSVEGTGEVQLSYFVEKQCKKTTVYRTYISKSLGATTPTPDPGRDWVNHIIHIGASVEGEYKKAESYAHGGTGIREGEDTDNAKYYSDETKKMYEDIGVDFEYIEQSKQEVSKNRVAVEQAAKEVKKSEQTIKQSEQNVIEKEKNVVALEGNTEEAKKHVDTATAEVDKNAKEVAANKDIVVKAEQNIGNAIAEHNVSLAAHEDIRGLISGLTARIDAVLDSDDVTLDQLSEIVAYIKSNKSLIEQVTTNKVNVSDIINNLTTNDSNKPLSASMGVELKRLIDELNKALLDYVKKVELPTKLPNPKRLLITGAVNAEYDGDEEIIVDIPHSGGKEWELVKSVTVTEEVNQILIDLNKEYDEFLFYVVVKNRINTTASNLLIGFNQFTSTSYALAYQGAGTNKNYYIRGISKRHCNSGWITYALAGNNESPLSTQCGKASKYYYGVGVKSNTEKPTAINAYLQTGFGAGSEFVVYAR